MRRKYPFSKIWTPQPGERCHTASTIVRNNDGEEAFVRHERSFVVARGMAHRRSGMAVDLTQEFQLCARQVRHDSGICV